MVIRLVVFDVDGTLTQHNSSWARLHEVFGVVEEGQKHYAQYFAGEISYQEWADLDAGLWAGKPVSKIQEIAENIKLVSGARETVQALKDRGINVAILSGGIDLLANKIAQLVGIDYALVNKLHHENGLITGKVEVLVGYECKAIEIREIVEHYETPFSETAFVGDGRNDISVFGVVGLAIAFNPEHEEVANAADITIRDPDLREILSHILSPS
ncbi:MAG: HAD family hydrolase [Candidatus Thorarchaeota archaeon]